MGHNNTYALENYILDTFEHKDIYSSESVCPPSDHLKSVEHNVLLLMIVQGSVKEIY